MKLKSPLKKSGEKQIIGPNGVMRFVAADRLIEGCFSLSGLDLLQNYRMNGILINIIKF